jgi:hypothetical protein
VATTSALRRAELEEETDGMLEALINRCVMLWCCDVMCDVMCSVICYGVVTLYELVIGDW